METTTTARPSLDRTGRTITTFVVFDVASELRGMDEGDVLELTTEDFEPFESDIRAWCDATGHALLASEAIGESRRFLIEKGSALRNDKACALVISSDGLEELLSPLGFALAAALEGMDVQLYFQGPAVRVLSHGFQPKLRGWSRPFSRIAARGMTRTGHIPAQDKLRQLRSLGATIYLCGGSIDHFKVDREDFIFDDIQVVEYFTFMSVMAEADVHIYS